MTHPTSAAHRPVPGILVSRPALLLSLLMAFLPACAEPGGGDPPAHRDFGEGSGEELTPDPAEDGPVSPPRILFLGTSLTAGYGVFQDQAYPALLQERLERAGLPHRVENAGVSGETSAEALGRIDRILRRPFEVLVVETGANDMLQGVDPEVTRDNIQAIVDRVRNDRPGVAILLLGMRAFPHLGHDYAERFARIYRDLAEENDIALVPFLLEEVAGQRSLNLPDAVHPNPAGHRRMAETVWPVLRDVLRDAPPGR